MMLSRKPSPSPSLDDLESVASELDDDCGGSVDQGKDTKESSFEESNSGTVAGKDERIQLAKRETVAVNRLRALVFFVLLLAAITVCIIVYRITKTSDDNAYLEQYEGAAAKVTEAFLAIMETKMAAATTMTVAMTAYANDQRKQWPFVTLPDFQQRAATARTQSGALYFQVHPLVTNESRKQWEEDYVVGNASYWIQEGIEYQENVGLFAFKADEFHGGHLTARAEDRWPIWGYPHSDSSDDSDDEDEEDENEEDEDDRRKLQQEDEEVHEDEDDEDDSDDHAHGTPQIEEPAEALILMPTWQTSPVIHGGHEVNENLLTAQEKGGPYAWASFTSGQVALSHFEMTDDVDSHTQTMSTLLSVAKQKTYVYTGSPTSTVFFPVFDSFEENRNPVAVMGALVHWTDFFENILPTNVEGIVAVLHTTCEGDDDDDPTSFTFEIDGEEVVPIGKWDLHDSDYDNLERKASFASVNSIADGTKQGIPLDQEHCVVSINVYPSDQFYDAYHTNTPIMMTVAVALVFVFAAVMFLVYDRLVEYRQKLVLNSAEKTNRIVTSLFPANVRDRLLQQETNEKSEDSFGPNSKRLKGFLNGNEAKSDLVTESNDPIADLFPHCTVLFADISGFTAWSSTREPRQVFILLQTLYEAFDKVAKRRRVFKVETIGDSYVAVTGLPEPQSRHAVIMALFAGECKIKMNELVASLESSLGPDTGELSMRFGLHSGPVTAGVLRGERARFQLFGDTVNTAARMESTGMRNKIQCSETTYRALVEAGKSSWLTAREDQVQAKGKGMMHTWWIDPTLRQGSAATNTTSSSMSDQSESQHLMAPQGSTRLPSSTGLGTLAKDERLVNWIVALLQENIRKLVAARKESSGKSTRPMPIYFETKKDEMSLDEVAETIVMPKFNAERFVSSEDIKQVKIKPEVVAQLHTLVAEIASMYRENPFHNFEHAAHVTMATDKFLKRIVAPDIEGEDEKMASNVHAFTHGINTSDPLLLFGILFSALIHDVDHRGVSNGQLAVEATEMAAKYRNKSIAEQNSLDLAWDLLGQDRFSDLHQCLFTDQSELERFRQILVNVVLATDIFDKDFNDLRKRRWNQAFAAENVSEGTVNHDLRATIVLEHIIQASDVSHTMQHWHIYRKWNARLFEELNMAYQEGRMAKDPSTFWYEGELGFFDNYVIPLARKLKECRVFGVCSDECLDYALQNRNEWKQRGRQIVTDMQLQLAPPQSVDRAHEVESANAEFHASVISV